MGKRFIRTRFTLIELLAVCGILALLMGIGIGVYSVANRKMSDAKCRAMIAKMCTALQNYYSKHGYYIQSATTSGFYIDTYAGQTPNINEFIEIQTNEIVDGGSYRKGTSTDVRGSAWKDPFDNQFQYRCPGKHNPTSFDLHSPGPDNVGTIDSPGADDLTNWTQ